MICHFRSLMLVAVPGNPLLLFRDFDSCCFVLSFTVVFQYNFSRYDLIGSSFVIRDQLSKYSNLSAFSLNLNPSTFGSFFPLAIWQTNDYSLLHNTFDSASCIVMCVVATSTSCCSSIGKWNPFLSLLINDFYSRSNECT